ncbi:MAG: hypothetical protein PHS86_04095 [Syntrophaceae bacterium]|nr:hypothetical protein [Syntrophaceae bacterium]
MSWIHQRENMAREILKLLYDHKMIRTFYRDKPDGWRLMSGIYSPIYIQLRPLVSYPEVFKKICEAMCVLLREEAPEIRKVVGIAMAGVPLVAGMAVAGLIPAAFTRKMEKVKSVEDFRSVIQSYGEHSLVEGEIKESDKIALVDDLVTRFDSKLIALEQVRSEFERRKINSAECKTVLVVLDREQGGAEAAQLNNLKLISLIKFKSTGLEYLRPHMDKFEWNTIADYLEDADKYQNPDKQKNLAERASIYART